MHRRNSEETMQRLIDAGAELFDKKGYHNVSIKEIGRLAGCNSALISYHFGSETGPVPRPSSKASWKCSTSWKTGLKKKKKCLSSG